MLVILDSNDLRNLSAKTRAEILRLTSQASPHLLSAISAAPLLPPEKRVKSKSGKKAAAQQKDQRLQEVTAEQAADLVSTVNDRAVAVMKLVVRARQPFDWSAAGKYKGYEANRFLSAFHRRLGTLTKGKYRPIATIQVDGQKTLLRFSDSTVETFRKALAAQ